MNWKRPDSLDAWNGLGVQHFLLCDIRDESYFIDYLTEIPISLLCILTPQKSMNKEASSHMRV